MVGDKGITRKQFLIGGAAAVATAGAIGTAYRVLRPSRQVGPTSFNYDGPVISLEMAAAADPVDVCIIGTGPAGTALGLDLARRGLRVLILDSGRNLEDVGRDKRLRALEVFDSVGAINYPLAASRARALGGTSNFWTGRCSRLHPLDFEQNAYTPEGAGWPLTYDQFEAYYTRADKTLEVQGGRLSNNRAPRTEPLPHIKEPNNGGLRATLESIGITADDSPTSRVQSQRGKTMRIGRDLLPALTAQPAASLLPGATVTRLLSDSGDHVMAAEVRDLDNNVRNIRAKVFVLAGGGIASPRLLLQSTSDDFPAGLGNGHGLVGQYFNEHPNLTFFGEIPASSHRFMPNPEFARSHQYYEEFKQRGLGSILMAFHHAPIEKKSENVRVRIGATMEMEPVAGNRVILNPDRSDYFGAPGTSLDLSFTEKDEATMLATRELIRDIFARLDASNVMEAAIAWSHHHIGSCRMGTGPNNSVVDGNLKLHGSDNLYVLGSANFVTGGASHPTLAIVGFAHRLADHLAAGFSVGRFGFIGSATDTFA